MKTNDKTVQVCPECGTGEIIADVPHHNPHSVWCMERQLAAERETRKKAETERDEARASYAATLHAIQRVTAIIASVPDCEGGCVQAARELLANYAELMTPPSPGQALLDELAKLREIVSRLRDDGLPNRVVLGVVFGNDNRRGVLTYSTQIDAYRAAVLGEKENEK